MHNRPFDVLLVGSSRDSDGDAPRPRGKIGYWRRSQFCSGLAEREGHSASFVLSAYFPGKAANPAV
jgi:hypothetical protein